MKVDIFKGIILKVFFTMSKICEKVQCSYYFILNLFSTFYKEISCVCKYCLKEWFGGFKKKLKVK